MSNTVELLLATDQNYAKYAGVVIVSALRALSPDYSLSVTILDGGISKLDIDRLRTIVSARNSCSIRFINLAESRVNRFKVSAHWSPAIFYRLLVSEFYPDYFGRVIYLDCDVLVRDSLHLLCEVDLNGKALGAVLNPGSSRGYQIGLKNPMDYFNSGVLVIDLEKWRRDCCESKLMHILAENDGVFMFPDQDALNLVFDGAFAHLPFRWNIQVSMFTKSQFYPAISASAVVHYTTHRKPWHKFSVHPFTREYRVIGAMTPWANQLSKFTGISCALKSVPRYLFLFLFYDLYKLNKKVMCVIKKYIR